MEEEIARNHCRRLISLVRSKQLHFESSEEERERHGHKGASGREDRSECERQVVAGDEFPDRRQRTKRDRGRTSPGLMSQGPEVQPSVPHQLILMLRLKTFDEEMRRAAEVELHGPAVCSVCEQEQASLALKSFIRRKKTQLRFQTLKDRLNTHHSYGESSLWGEFVQNLPEPFDAPRWIWEELLGGHMRVTATWGCLSNG